LCAPAAGFLTGQSFFVQDVLTAIQEAPYSTSPKKGMVANTKTAARDQVGSQHSHNVPI
jgi:hypothetical protein